MLSRRCRQRSIQQSLRAVPLSLAATNRISVDFFSYGYLDVSVPRVRFIYPMNSDKDTWVISSGFPHSEISGSKSVCRLPEAYRRLQRPSSPSAAKASTRCTFMLDHIIQNTLTNWLYNSVSRTPWVICSLDFSPSSSLASWINYPKVVKRILRHF